MHSHMPYHVQIDVRDAWYSRCTKVMNSKHAVTYANPWRYRRIAQDDSLTIQPHNKHANDSDDDTEKAR